VKNAVIRSYSGYYVYASFLYDPKKIHKISQTVANLNQDDQYKFLVCTSAMLTGLGAFLEKFDSDNPDEIETFLNYLMRKGTPRP
jgi:hypothetical protein